MAITWSLPSLEPGSNATSMEAPPASPPWEDLRHVAPVRSIPRSPFSPARVKARGDNASALSISYRGIAATRPVDSSQLVRILNSSPRFPGGDPRAPDAGASASLAAPGHRTGG